MGPEENPSYVRCDKDGVRRCLKCGAELRKDGTCPLAWYTKFRTEVHGPKEELERLKKESKQWETADGP